VAAAGASGFAGCRGWSHGGDTAESGCWRLPLAAAGAVWCQLVGQYGIGTGGDLPAASCCSRMRYMQVSAGEPGTSIRASAGVDSRARRADSRMLIAQPRRWFRMCCKEGQLAVMPGGPSQAATNTHGHGGGHILGGCGPGCSKDAALASLVSWVVMAWWSHGINATSARHSIPAAGGGAP
jgi:hypothetical protein